mmetsp:Transcript_10059/g.14942  ORF Transcript_10059/g.14942 Transcript_10059/m.14942 type:complete len:176 (-) Transcript_10059:214-741(-)
MPGIKQRKKALPRKRSYFKKANTMRRRAGGDRSSGGRSTRGYSNSTYSAAYGKDKSSSTRTQPSTKHKPRTGASTYTRSSSASSSPQAYCYSLNLKNGKKYVGYTTNLNQRLSSHFSGNGAKATQKQAPTSVNHVQKCRSVATAKKAEQIVYKNMARYHGTQKVRGAGHTSSKNF